jgi:ornithine cyclodeaminase
MGDVLIGAASFARADSDITVFDMTGLALQDLTVAQLVFLKARARGLGTRIAWPW